MERPLEISIVCSSLWRTVLKYAWSVLLQAIQVVEVAVMIASYAILGTVALPIELEIEKETPTAVEDFPFKCEPTQQKHI